MNAQEIININLKAHAGCRSEACLSDITFDAKRAGIKVIETKLPVDPTGEIIEFGYYEKICMQVVQNTICIEYC